MSTQTLSIRIRPLEASLGELRSLAGAIHAGAEMPEQAPSLVLPSIEAYYVLLTPKRIELLHWI